MKIEDIYKHFYNNHKKECDYVLSFDGLSINGRWFTAQDGHIEYPYNEKPFFVYKNQVLFL